MLHFGIKNAMLTSILLDAYSTEPFMIAKSTMLGRGIYTPSEAAVYARVKPQTLNRWLFGDSRGDAAIIAEAGTIEDRQVTFLDFVQLLAVRDIRVKHKVPLVKIREAIEIARQLGIDYPFAKQHKTFLFGDLTAKGHGEVVLEVDGELLQVSGKAKRNQVMREVAELYMQDLYFDSKSQFATAYHPFSSALNGSVVMNPKIRFGEPIVEKCGYPAEVLFEAYQTEGSVDAAALAFGVERDDIVVALRYYDLLAGSSV